MIVTRATRPAPRRGGRAKGPTRVVAPGALVALVALVALTLLPAAPASALPPFDTLLEQLHDFRRHEGDVTLRGQMTYGPVGQTRVTITREWSEPPTLSFAGSEVVADWRDGDTDVVFRLLGVALSAPDLSEAIADMGRTVEPTVQTLMFLADDTLVYVIGGSLRAPTARYYVERDTYRLRGIDLPMPEGTYRIELRDYDLASGWLPGRIVVYRDDRTLLDLELESAS